MRAQIAKSGLVPMERIWDNGFRQITSSTKPIQTADDLKGFKIRVPVSPLWTSMFKALDASPASINFSEVYSALQSKVVDGQENPLAVIATAKLYEVQKYCSMTNHMWDGFWFLANGNAWARLPDDLRGIVARNVNARCAEGARRRRRAQQRPAERTFGQGPRFQRAEYAELSRAHEKGRLLQRVEGQVRRRGLGHPGAQHRQARLSAAPAA